MKVLPYFILSLIAIITLSSCNKDKTVDCETVSATFSNDISPILTASCNTASCHSSTSNNSDYTTYDKIKVAVDNGILRTRVVDKKNMPIGSSLSQDQIDKFQCWLDAGAPNN